MRKMNPDWLVYFIEATPAAIGPDEPSFRCMGDTKTGWDSTRVPAGKLTFGARR
jgi:hypothetical protein